MDTEAAASEGMTPLRVCIAGIYDPGYARNQVIIKGLQQAGVRVMECRVDPKARGRYITLAKMLRQKAKEYDVILAAYPAPTTAIVARLCSSAPLVTDAFLSMYDAVVHDRKQYSPYHPRALYLLLLDWLSVKIATVALTDTAQHVNYWTSWWGLSQSTFRVLPIGSDPDLFKVTGSLPQHTNVLFHGTYIPLQGVTMIIRAFALLKDETDITFRMVGDGQDFKEAEQLIKDSGMTDRIQIIRRVPFDEIPAYIQASDIVLGIFGATDKAQRVVPNKVYEGLAAGKAVITMDTPALRELFSEEEIYRALGTPESLAEAIRTLTHDSALRDSYAKRGHEALVARYSPRVLGERLKEYFLEVVN